MGAHVKGGLVVLVVVLAGCGGGGSGEASKSASQILKDASSTLAHAHSVKMSGNVLVEGQPTKFTAELEQPEQVNMTMTQGSREASIVVLSGTLYVKANSAFWTSEPNVPSALVPLVEGRWFKVPATGGIGFAKAFTTNKLGKCLTANAGSLVVGGESTVDGQSAVDVTDKGNEPGTTPAKFFVATSGKPYLLRALATGTRKPGGSGGECQEGTPASPGEEITFSDYNGQMKIKAPSGAIDIAELEQQLGAAG